MWCDACRSVGTIHCAYPDECGNMLSNSAAAESWNAWLDDLPIGAEFHPAIDRLQDFIAGLATPAPDPAAIRCECGMSMPCMADPCKHPLIQKEPTDDRA